MSDFLGSNSIPAIFYKVKDQSIIPNEKACEILKNNPSVKQSLDGIFKYTSQKDFREWLCDIYIVGENRNLVSFYCLQLDDSYESCIVIIQDISMSLIKTISRKSDTVIKSENNIRDIIVTDEKGIILSISEFFEKFYNVKSNQLLGKSIFKLEQSGIFYPSATAKVLKTGQRITMLQKNKINHEILVTAIPVRDNNQNIAKVVCFSYDVTDFLKIKSLEKNIKRIENKQIVFPGIIASNQKMQKILKIISKVANFDVNVIITGESGVGKSYFARLIHRISKRSKGPFMELNCGAIPENLLESELFGYEGGSFTGAKKEGKVGLIELSRNGTLFLDEIGELPLNLQVKLLKVIQDKTFNRIGGTKSIKVNFRLITATNRDLKNLIKQKKFREDLFYRLNVVNIDIPPLRERREDITDLILHFVKDFNTKYKLNKSLSIDTMNMLIRYKWTGNIRELENVIERTLLISDNDIVTDDFLPESIRYSDKKVNMSDKIVLQEELENYERQLVVRAFKKYKTTVGVAKCLGISQATAVRKIKKYVNKL